MTNGQAYPNEVDYTGNDGATLTPYASVKFVYGVTRNDIIPAYQAGYLQQTTVLLTNIQTFVGTTMITNYKLGYTYASNGLEHDELTSVTQCDNTSPTPICLKPTTFGWQGSRDTLTMNAVPNGLSQGIATNLGQLEAGFWQGSGLTDVQTFGTTVCDIYYGTNASGFVDSGITANYTQWIDEEGTWSSLPYSGPPCFPVTSRHHPFDMNGDGFTDILLNQRTSVSDNSNFLHPEQRSRCPQSNLDLCRQQPDRLWRLQWRRTVRLHLRLAEQPAL